MTLQSTSTNNNYRGRRRSHGNLPRFKHQVQLSHHDFKTLNQLLDSLDDLDVEEKQTAVKVKEIYALMLSAQARKIAQ